MTKTQDWIDGYARAWQSKDEADVRAIFTDDAECWFRPNDAEPVRGIDAIVEMWGDDEPTEPEFAFDVLTENDRLGVATGHVDYPGDKSYTNLWEVHFGDDGKARKFVEWWMLPRGES